MHPKVKELQALFVAKKNKPRSTYWVITTYKDAAKVLGIGETRLLKHRKRHYLPPLPFTRQTLVTWYAELRGWTRSINQRAELVRLKLAGATKPQIAKEFGVDETWIPHLWRKTLADYTQIAQDHPDLPPTKEEMLKLWQQILMTRQGRWRQRYAPKEAESGNKAD